MFTKIKPLLLTSCTMQQPGKTQNSCALQEHRTKEIAREMDWSNNNRNRSQGLAKMFVGLASVF
jgi:hypothetical protein